MAITTIKSGNLVKTFMVGVVAAAGFGLMTLPAKANEIVQDGYQTTVQEGYGNTSVEQLNQDAEIKDSARGYYGGYGHDHGKIRQRGDQYTNQYGEGNVSVEQMNQDASLRQDRGSFYRH